MSESKQGKLRIQKIRKWLNGLKNDAESIWMGHFFCVWRHFHSMTKIQFKRNIHLNHIIPSSFPRFSCFLIWNTFWMMMMILNNNNNNFIDIIMSSSFKKLSQKLWYETLFPKITQHKHYGTKMMFIYSCTNVNFSYQFHL